MRKLALAIVLVLVLVGGAVGGMGVVTGANGGPSLSVNGHSAPGVASISGSGWTPGLSVDLWMDVHDPAHHVAVATPSSFGQFSTSFLVGPTTLGLHKIIGKQGANPEVSATFTITSTSQVDDRTESTLNAIEEKLDNIAYGLQQTKDDVSDIHNVVGHGAIYVSNHEYLEASTDSEWVYVYLGVTCHVSLTIETDLDGFDNVVVLLQAGPDPSTYWLLARINAPSFAEAHTFEFDASVWKIHWHVDTGATTPTLKVGWQTTITYAQNLIVP